MPISYLIENCLTAKEKEILHGLTGDIKIHEESLKSEKQVMISWLKKTLAEKGVITVRLKDLKNPEGFSFKQNFSHSPSFGTALAVNKTPITAGKNDVAYHCSCCGWVRAYLEMCSDGLHCIICDKFLGYYRYKGKALIHGNEIFTE
jgi:hypothetical protein